VEEGAQLLIMGQQVGLAEVGLDQPQDLQEVLEALVIHLARLLHRVIMADQEVRPLHL
jgi:hypothetical protein